MRYCVVCGVPITRWFPEQWLREFRAVWIENDNWDNVKVSGVGICDEYNDVVTGTVPIDPSKRYDDALAPDSTIDVALMVFCLRHFVDPEPPRYEPEPFWGWGFHSSCWDILNTGFTPNLRLLFEACLSMPIGQDSIMDWGHDYDGAATIINNHGVSELGRVSPNLAGLPQNLRSDPFDIPVLGRAIQHSARLQNDTFQSHLSSDQLNLQGDKFSCLSPELLQLIATLLPTRDVRSLRLASPTFAVLSLPEKFWASRFQPGHEFGYISEAVGNPPDSWRALYLSLQIWAVDNSNMANRKRVWGLAKRLQAILHQMDDRHCHGSPLKTWFEPSIPNELPARRDKVLWRTAARGIRSPSDWFERGCRVLRARALHLQPLEVQCISVSFVHVGSSSFVSGLLFIDKNGQDHALGYLHHNQSESIRFSAPQRIRGWELALDLSGIKAIAAIMEDGSTSSWAGRPGDFPRWYLAEPAAISAVKAEFDALKLVSLSRDTSCQPSEKIEWRSNCLWYPSFPPEGMFFNGSQGDQPPKSFDRPVTTLFFGEPDGRHMPSPIEIVIWIFDIAYIAGIEVVYSDVSQNRRLGSAGPFGDNYARRNFGADSQDHRIAISLDAAKGEELKVIEVQDPGGGIVGLKLRTNIGQEVTTPQHPFATKKPWTTIQPTGSKVVGLFCTHSHIFQNIGLISTNCRIEQS